jgi:hypothetical protein
MVKAKKSSAFKKYLSLIAIVVIIIAIILTVAMSGQQQETRQRAAGTECLYAFNSQSVCASYCSAQQGKVCYQSLNGKWGCCESAKTEQTTGITGTMCSRCSDTYKFCHIAWKSNQNCQDTWNGQYSLNCNCTQGNLDCNIKGVDTSSCN